MNTREQKAEERQEVVHYAPKKRSAALWKSIYYLRTEFPAFRSTPSGVWSTAFRRALSNCPPKGGTPNIGNAAFRVRFVNLNQDLAESGESARKQARELSAAIKTAAIYAR